MFVTTDIKFIYQPKTSNVPYSKIYTHSMFGTTDIKFIYQPKTSNVPYSKIYTHSMFGSTPKDSKSLINVEVV